MKRIKTIKLLVVATGNLAYKRFQESDFITAVANKKTILVVDFVYLKDKKTNVYKTKTTHLEVIFGHRQTYSPVNVYCKTTTNSY